MTQPEAYLDDSKKLKTDDKFRFACTKDKPCFTACCYDVSLMLMPYDIYRLKKYFNMDSEAFLKRFTSLHIGPGTGIPIVMLKMEEPSLKCPFLDAETGCQVYSDRPAVCRTYPLVRLNIKSGETGEIDDFYYVLKEPNCTGFKDSKEQSIAKWIEQEGLAQYNEMNDLFAEVVHAKNSKPEMKLNADQIEQFYLGCYNLDGFRRFFIESPNLDRYMESEETLQKLAHDDMELLKYGIRWVKRKLFEGGCFACAGSCGSK